MDPTWLLILGTLYLIPSTLSSKIDDCNHETDYILKNLTSGKFLGCPHVRECGVSYEPIIPRGQVIGIHDIIGPCKPCDNGTYSPTEGPEPCQICLSANCSEHQVGEGSCTDKRDDSYCKCKDGYVVNKEGTACEVYKPQQSTTGKPTTRKPTTQKPTPNPTTSNLTTKKLTTNNPTTNEVLVPINERKDKKSELPLGLKVAISFIVLVVIVVIIIVTWHYFKKLQRTDSRGKDEKKDLPSTEQLLDQTEAGKKETLKFGKEEECKEDGLPTANGPHCLETTGGYAASDNVSPNIANNINMSYMASTPTTRYDPLLIGIPENAFVKIKMGKANEW